MNGYICYNCGSSYSLDKIIWRCTCGGLLDIDYKPVFDMVDIRGKKPTMWRYRKAIPITYDNSIVSFDEGLTPLSEIEIQGKAVYIKQEHLFLTGSYKDRGASVLISKVKELGIGKVVEDSSGNAGCSISAYCAKSNIECHIYVPDSTSPNKLVQIQLYGAKLHKIPGSREDTANAVLKAAEKFYYASHSWNPFFLHGTKTFAFEICEQMDWKSPDTLVLPAGNGTLLLGGYLGFNELYRAGIIDKIPRIVAVQSANCAPLYRMYKDKLDYIPEIQTKHTLAEGIAIAQPVRGRQIIDAVEKTNGLFIVVEEEEIKEALINMCGKGYFIEITAAAAIAGLRKYIPKSKEDEVIVSVFTGHGLKTADKMLEL